MSLEIALKRIQEAKEKNAHKLDLSNLELTKIPSELSELSSLNELVLSGNQLSDVNGLEQLSQLIQLDLSENKLTEIKGLDELVQLTELDLSNNQLVEIKGLEQLSKLTLLFLSSNKFVEIKGLEKLTSLNTLTLINCEFTEIKGLENLTGLNFLNLNGNNIAEIKGLECLVQLTELHLSNNGLREIKGLECLTQLKRLGLNGNKFTEIKGVEALINLRAIEFADNEIEEISGVENLMQLESFEIRRNKLKNIRGLSKLTQLETLYFPYNNVTKLDGLEQLTNLTKLKFHDNSVIALPEYILQLKQPIYWEIGYDKGVYVGNNPFTEPSPEIIKQGNKAIKEYFNQRRKSGDELLNEAKLILLGDARSGKTSLANRLQGKELPKEADRTQGVDIVIGGYSFPTTVGKDFKVNIWDFAGQDKYKTLHQLFYTDSSLYVMVAESGNTTVDYDDWFQAAALFGEGSPLILVLNEFKEGIGMSSFDSDYWKKQFPDLLKEVFTVNLGTKKGFSTAEEYIRLLAQTLPHTKYAFPANWAAIRRVLNSRRNEQYISLEEYLEICKSNNLPERESALILSSVLHKVGDCLHYQKSKLLRQLIILKNEWATEAVYKILDDKVVAEGKCGFFDESDVERIWCSKEYADMQPQLLELMKQFKLAYQLPGKEEYVTPPLLPTARPARFMWLEGNSLELYIEYEFLPKALLTQFIVTRHADIADNRTLVWRHGVILKWEVEAIAEVSKTKLEGKDAFYIKTQGSHRKELMTLILKTFRELHGEYKGIKYKEKVPCICDGCRTGKNKQHYFDFENLKLRLERRRYEVECDKSLELVNVIELLENNFVFEQFKEGFSLQLKENIKPRLLKIFLASSNELLDEREKIEQAIGRKNKSLKRDGFSVELSIWEDNKHIGKSFRSQSNYNLEIEECDVFALMFYSKVGKYTSEEFDTAYSLFEKSAKPRMLIYQKDVPILQSQSEADAQSRFAFIKRLTELEHFPEKFDNTDKLIRLLEDAIDKLLQDESFTKQLKVE